MIHLAKTPHGLVFTAWCGMDERRGRRPLNSPVLGRDGNEIALHGAFDCHACRRAIEAMARHCAAILGAIPVERPSVIGCGDHSCAVSPPSGMGTNGGCSCEPRMTRMAATLWRGYALALESRLDGTDTKGLAQQPPKVEPLRWARESHSRRARHAVVVC